MKTPTNNKRVRWSNGHVDTARTWQTLLDRIRYSQWTVWTEEQFRAVLAKRALRWSGTEIDYLARPRRLFRELERAGMVEVLNPYENEEDF